MENKILYKKIMEDDTFLNRRIKKLKEMSVTGDVAGYDSPNTFSKNPKKPENTEETTPEDWEEVDKEKVRKNFYPVWTEMTNINLKEAIESSQSYQKALARGEKITPKKEINLYINDINKKLQEVEKFINKAIRFKNESGLDNSSYWGDTRRKFGKIKERINRLTVVIQKFGE